MMRTINPAVFQTYDDDEHCKNWFDDEEVNECADDNGDDDDDEDAILQTLDATSLTDSWGRTCLFSFDHLLCPHLVDPFHTPSPPFSCYLPHLFAISFAPFHCNLRCPILLLICSWSNIIGTCCWILTTSMGLITRDLTIDNWHRVEKSETNEEGPAKPK